MDNNELIVERQDPIAVVTLNRPDSGNALTEGLLNDLQRALAELASSEVRCVLIKGAGEKNFSVGMDLTAMSQQTAPENQRLIGPGGPLRLAIAEIEDFPYPVIAMVRGYAAGAACELAVSCDLRVGCAQTLMGMPPAKLGIVYPPEGLERFVQTLGLATARRLFLTARYFQGDELYAMGLLDFLCGEELEGFTMELAREIVRLAPLSMRGHKRALTEIARSIAPRIDDEQREALNELGKTAMNSTDAAEGLSAFLDKRKSTFRGI